MKNRLLPLICGAALIAAYAFSNDEATAQSAPVSGSSSNIELPMGRPCIVTLDARSNSRASLTQEMQQFAGFVRPDTVQGRLIHLDAQWLVLKTDSSENWIPREKILMIRAGK